jgi:hypothetical protein
VQALCAEEECLVDVRKAGRDRSSRFPA